MTGPVTLAPLDFEKALRVIETPTGWGTREYEAELQRQARAYAEALVATAKQYLDRVCVAMGENADAPLAAVLAVEQREATWQKACDILKSGPGWPEKMWPSLDDRIRCAAVIERAEAAGAKLAEVCRLATGYAGAPCITELLGDEPDSPCICFVCAHRAIVRILTPLQILPEGA